MYLQLGIDKPVPAAAKIPAAKLPAVRIVGAAACDAREAAGR